MSSVSSSDRLVKNEQLLRDKNLAAGRGIKKYFRGDKAVRQAPIAFMCECSSLDCNRHVNVSIDVYEKLHQRKDRFLIFPGHITAEVEKLVAHEDEFDIVEKHSLKA